MLAVLPVFGVAMSKLQKEETGKYIDGSAMAARVKAAILNTPSLKVAEINVETVKGRDARATS